MNKYLVAYGSHTGSTEEVALKMGELLRNKGFDVDVQNIKDVDYLKHYSGVIIGAPIHGMKWYPEAEHFVEKHHTILESIPTACFLLSYILVQGAPFWRKTIAKSMNMPKSIIDPFSIGMFGGRVKDALPAPMRLIFGIKKNAPMDAIEWEKIEEWIEGVAQYFRLNT